MNKQPVKGNITRVVMYHAGAIAEENVAITIARESSGPNEDKDVKFYWQNSAQANSNRGKYGFNIIRSLLTATELNLLHKDAEKFGVDARIALRMWANNGTLAKILDNREVMVGEKKAVRKNGEALVDSKGNQRIDYTPYPVAYQMDDQEFITLAKAQADAVETEEQF